MGRRKRETKQSLSFTIQLCNKERKNNRFKCVLPAELHNTQSAPLLLYPSLQLALETRTRSDGKNVEPLLNKRVLLAKEIKKWRLSKQSYLIDYFSAHLDSPSKKQVYSSFGMQNTLCTSYNS